MLLEGKDKNDIPEIQQVALGFVSIIEEAMVKGFPYEVPTQYADLPQLKVTIPHPGNYKTRQTSQNAAGSCPLMV